MCIVRLPFSVPYHIKIAIFLVKKNTIPQYTYISVHISFDLSHFSTIYLPCTSSSTVISSNLLFMVGNTDFIKPLYYVNNDFMTCWNQTTFTTATVVVQISRAISLMPDVLMITYIFMYICQTFVGMENSYGASAQWKVNGSLSVRIWNKSQKKHQQIYSHTKLAIHAYVHISTYLRTRE